MFQKKREKNHKQSIGILKGLINFKENKNSSKKTTQKLENLGKKNQKYKKYEFDNLTPY